MKSPPNQPAESVQSDQINARTAATLKNAGTKIKIPVNTQSADGSPNNI